MILKQLAEDLINTATNSLSTDDEINAVVGSLYEAAERAAPNDVNESMVILSSGLNLEDTAKAGFLAKVCVALVEYGGNISNISTPLIDKLGELLKSSELMLEECLHRMPTNDEISKKQEDKAQDHLELFTKTKQQVAVYMSAEAEAWNTLDIFWPPAIDMFSISPEARAEASYLTSLTNKLAPYQNGSHWLDIMLKVLHEESVLVIEPAKNLGIVGRMSGIAGNFQLHVLLMDVFPQRLWLQSPRVLPHITELARGNGPQQTDDIVSGQWNMYCWQALQPNLHLPDPKKWPSDEQWIWGEGLPADIPVFDGHRVVLLGPPSYLRTWRSQRLFENLSANIEIVKKLSRSEVQQWLRRMTKEAEQARLANRR
jgi:hypothetical protein